MTIQQRVVVSIAAAAIAATCVRAAEPQAGTETEARRRMVEIQLEQRGISNPRVLDAMRKVPRHLFVPEPYRSRAYQDTPLPIGFQQTISQPYIVAYMTEALNPVRSDRVLEIGTGSGYQAAILAELAGEVYTIELLEPLATRARTLLVELGYTNVHARQGDGYRGWPEAAPFHKIIVTAAPDVVPQALVDQLAVGGVMVVPVGTGQQMMTIIRKTEKGVTSEQVLPVRFVPMVGGDR